jgi:hypothetical protein
MEAVMHGSGDSVTFKTAIVAGIKNLRHDVISSSGSEIAAVLVMMFLVGIVTCPLAFFADARVVANGQAPPNPCAASNAAKSTTPVINQVQVSSASATTDSLEIYTGRADATTQRVSTPLSVQNGLLPPNECLQTVVSDLVRTDGEVIPSDQVTSWAVSGNAGLRVFVFVEVNPRYGSVTPSGGYTGTVSMDDDRAIGGNIPVNVHVEYPSLWRAAMVCIVAAWFGFFWAWLIHLTKSDSPVVGRFWLYLVLQLAVLTIVSFPVLNAQILTNPDWQGDVSQYIALASLAGGGALATTPTLRALIDRAANLLQGNTEGAAASTTSSADTPPSPASNGHAADAPPSPVSNGHAADTPPSAPEDAPQSPLVGS